MSDVSFVGPGLMGSALARAWLRQGADLTDWNRSPARSAAFAEGGAAVAQDLISAIAASPVVVICIDSYAATRTLLDGDAVAQDLAGFVARFPGNHAVQSEAALIAENRLDHPTATLEVWRHALARLQQQALDAGISSAIPDYYASQSVPASGWPGAFTASGA